MTIETKIRESFAKQAMMSSLHAKLILVGDGCVQIQAPILPAFTQQHDFAHAGVTFSLGDSAAGYAALTLMDENAEVLTAEMKINLLAPAKGDVLVATGKVIRPGKRLMVVTATVEAVTGNDRQDIAILQGTMVPVYR